MKPVISLMSACTLSLVGTALAQQPAEGQGREGIPATTHQEEALREIDSDLFQRLDQDSDGSISRQEAQAESSLSDSWSEYDENGDQTLDPQEFSAYERSSTTESEGAQLGQQGITEEGLPATRHQQEAVRDDLVEQLDRDDDGGISRQEAEDDPRLTSEWDRLDQNADGELDSTELALLEEEEE